MWSPKTSDGPSLILAALLLVLIKYQDCLPLEVVNWSKNCAHGEPNRFLNEIIDTFPMASAQNGVSGPWSAWKSLLLWGAILICGISHWLNNWRSYFLYLSTLHWAPTVCTSSKRSSLSHYLKLPSPHNPLFAPLPCCFCHSIYHCLTLLNLFTCGFLWFLCLYSFYGQSPRPEHQIPESQDWVSFAHCCVTTAQNTQWALLKYLSDECMQSTGSGTLPGKENWTISCGFRLQNAYWWRSQAKIVTVLGRIGCILRAEPCHSLRAREERRGKCPRPAAGHSFLSVSSPCLTTDCRLMARTMSVQFTTNLGAGWSVATSSSVTVLFSF